jgi:wyosine [tRNA(Phe)-imidazoG37] synthetase (radical SAM superfamily)
MLGSSGFLATKRSSLVSTEEVVEDLSELASIHRGLPIRFFGTGETTLASNLGEMIEAARASGVGSTAVLTNSTLMERSEVREDLERADVIIAKVDASDERSFQRINRPHCDVSFSRMVRGLRYMRSNYKGSLRLQIMLMKENESQAEGLAQLCSDLSPDLIYLSTPTRPCHATPLTYRSLQEISRRFHRQGLNVTYEGRGDRET